VSRRDEAAFEAIVRRHAALVFGVCRRILGDSHSADDAFQATFLVLARKAGRIRNSNSVSSWLHGVARRVAGRARESGRTRRWYERRWRRRPTPDALTEVVWRDLGAILDKEIQRLPERIRAPFVLCYLEGATNEAAARALDCPTGTILSRLSKARDVLRARLTRRGLVLSAGFLAAAPSEAAVSVPRALIEAARASVGVVTGTKPALAPAVMALAAGAVGPRWTTVGLSASGLMIAMACAVATAGRGGNPPAAPPPAVATPPMNDADRFPGTWVVTSSIYEGKAEPPAAIKDAKATFDGKTLTLVGPTGPQKLTFAIDPAAIPKTFDMTPADGPARSMTNRGIYRFDGDTLQICVPAGVSKLVIQVGPRLAGDVPRERVLAPPIVRPDEFSAPAGSFRRLFTLKRAAAEH
jgi:RNA polymerase sigma factor (sigma-70 family)